MGLYCFGRYDFQKIQSFLSEYRGGQCMFLFIFCRIVYNPSGNVVEFNFHLFCDVDKNPMKAWSQLEHDSWMARYEDYIECGGNGDMQRRIYPDMCDLMIVHMDDEQKLYELMRSRKL